MSEDGNLPEEGQLDFEFIGRLQKLVADSHVDDPGEAALKLATLHVEFDLLTLRGELMRMFHYSLEEENEEMLRDNCVYNSQRATFSVNESVRTQLLGRMSAAEIKDLLAGMDFQPNDRRQNLLNRLLRGEVPDLTALQREEYVQAITLLRWVRHPDVALPSVTVLEQAIRMEAQIAPLKRLTVNFSGREEQLAQLAEFVRPIAGKRKRFMSITGVGGIGKSTLISQCILEQLAHPESTPIFFVRIDFDDPGFSVADIFTLLKEALRQLGLQNPKQEPRYQQLVRRIDDEYGGLPFSESSASRGSDRQSFFSLALDGYDKMELWSLKTPVVVVLDSFEEVQYRASLSEIAILLGALREIGSLVPTLKVVFIGRVEIPGEDEYADKIEVENFDLISAVSFLRTQGIGDPELSQRFYTDLGGNPLTLQLAARLVVNQLGPEDRTIEGVTRSKLFDTIDKQVIQQQLVARNLDHIHNRDVANIAIPGMLLRRINPDIIRRVLAKVCGLGEIDEQQAEVLFGDLKKEAFLLKITGDEVEFRKDLRMASYDLILKAPEYKDKAGALNDAAIEYYRDREKPADQAEFLFHWLRSGLASERMAEFYHPAMKPYLESALVELPPLVRTRLSTLMGIGVVKETLDEAGLSLWEDYWLVQIKRTLEFGDEQQLIALREKLAERKNRTGNQEFQYYEWLLATRLLRFPDSLPAKKLIAEGIGDIRRQRLALPGTPRNFRLDMQAIYRSEFIQTDIAMFFEPLLTEDLKEWPAHRESLEAAIALYLSMARLRVREGREYELDPLRQAIVTLFNRSPDSGTMTIAELFGLLPKPYFIPMREWYDLRHPNINIYAQPATTEQGNRYLLRTILGDYLQHRVLLEQFIPKAEFGEKYAFLKQHIQTTAELETYSRRLYKTYLKDISLPGSLDILLFDFLLFAEAYPRETEELILEKLSSPAEFRKKTNVITPEDFVSMAEVKFCLEKLERTFAGEGKRKLLVSDILDEEGHQYVNLVQRSYGVQLFAVAGYTYILEQMGIRFLKTASTNTAAIPAALMGITGARNEANTGKVLGHLCRFDFGRVVDGSSLIRRIMKGMGTGSGHISRLAGRVSFLVVGVFISYVLFLAGASLLSTSVPYYNTVIAVAYFLFAGCGILLIYLFASFRRLIGFGRGVNPGNELYYWISDTIKACGIGNAEEFIRKTEETPKLLARAGVSYSTPLLKGNVSFLCAELISQNRIQFPLMSPLFWTRKDMAVLDPAAFVRAAASAPFIFDSHTVQNISVDSPEIKQAWIEYFGEYEPPLNASFTDGGVFSVFPITLFQTSGDNAPMPTFGIDTREVREKINGQPLKKLNWTNYIARLLDTSRYNIDREQLTRGKAMEKAICNIEIKKTGAMSYFLTDEEKLELFIAGAVAATEFLLQFDWEVYKKSLNTQTGLRL